MRWLASFLVFLVLFVPWCLFTVKIMTPELGVSVSCLVSGVVGALIGRICVLVWLDVDSWEQGY